MVDINSEQISNSQSITNAIFDSYYPKSTKYPNGKIVVENTSFGKSGVTGKTLTSRTISEAISGDILYRSPKFATTFYNKSIGSSLNSLITAGSESTFNSTATVTIVNPESTAYTDGDTSKPTTISGGAAFTRILADSIAAKQGGSGFVQGAADSIMEDYSFANSPANSDSPADHGDTPYNPDSSNPTAGARMVAITSRVSAEEKVWILERGKVLKDLGVVDDWSNLTGGFYFDINDSFTKSYAGDGISEFPNIDQTTNIKDVPLDIVQAPNQLAYISPALIECLIALAAKIQIGGGFGTGRWREEMQAGTKEDGSLSDHGFGRAYDIYFTGDLNGEKYSPWDNAGNVEIYRKAMDVLMTALSTLPIHIMPDIIVHMPELAAEYGVRAGHDADDAAVKLKYPNLKYIKFHPDAKHRNHIHISFSAARAGVYTGPGGAFTTGPIAPPATTPANPTSGLFYIPAGVVVPGNILNSKFTKSYKAANSGELKADEIFQLLTGTIAYPELAAVLTAISQREGNVGSWTPTIRGSKDYSFGFLQLNLLAYGRYSFLCPLPTVASIEGWKLAAPGWQYFGLTSFSQWDGFIRDISMSEANEATAEYQTNTKNSTDDRLWIPINQAFIAFETMTGRHPVYPLPADQKLGYSPEMQHVLGAWGDYDGGPTQGPITGVKWSDAVGVYTRNTNQTEDNLKAWVTKYFANPNNGATSKSAPYIQEWMSGTIF